MIELIDPLELLQFRYSCLSPIMPYDDIKFLDIKGIDFKPVNIGPGEII